MNVETIINESAEKLNVNEFNEFETWLKQNNIDKKNNFAMGLVEFVKNELDESEKGEDNGEHDVKVTIDEGDYMEIKEFIRCLSDEQRKIFRSIKYEDKKNYSRSEKESEYYAIRLLINFFIYKWNKEVKNLKFMFLVSNLLPYLVTKSYQIQIDDLTPKIDYVEVPGIKFPSCELSSTSSIHNKFPSTRENLWGYEFPTTEPSNFSNYSFFDRLICKI
jgi:hypothetical protein